MGEDFVFDTVDLLDGERGTVDGLVKLWRSRVDSLKEEDMDMETRDRLNIQDEEWLNAAKKMLHEDIDDLLEAIQEKRRDASVWTPPRSEWNGKPTKLLITGGTSFGGDPNDMFTIISRLYEENIIIWGDTPTPEEEK